MNRTKIKVSIVSRQKGLSPIGRRQVFSGLGASLGILTLLGSKSIAAVEGANVLQAGTVLITGSNRGIGLEFVRQYAKRGWTVIATCRTPAKADALNTLAVSNGAILVEEMDVTDHGEIDAVAQKYEGRPIDIIINNAGITGGMPAQTLGQMDFAVYQKVLDVNVKGPLKISEAFVDHVRSGTHKKIVVVSSREGSIAGVKSPRLYFYRSSKSAANMVTRSLAMDLYRDKVIVSALNPGPTDTDMMKGVRMPLQSLATSVLGMIGVIEGWTIKDTGKFFNFDGKPLLW